MDREPVKKTWFKLVGSAKKRHYEWLTPLGASVEHIAEFGCFSSNEPFLLLWILDAGRITVIELDKNHLVEPRKTRETLRDRSKHGTPDFRDCLKGRSIQFVVGDIKAPCLPSNYFELAYCDDVLYQVEMDSGEEAVRRAIGQMKRIVKPGGWVVAVESKIGAEHKEIPNPFGFPKPLIRRTCKPKDISSLFVEAGLERRSVCDAPE